jgi:hypothetical protein
MTTSCNAKHSIRHRHPHQYHQDSEKQVMPTKHVRFALSLPALIASVAWAVAAHADDFGSVELHGFGMQNYLQTSHNLYDDADHRGTWDDNFLGLVVAVTLNDKMKLWAQLETSSEDSTHFTWFFVDYQFSDDLTAHAGRIKFPLGIYNEIIDTKFLQVTSLEPFLYRAEADFVDDSYNGAGVDYTQSLGTAGTILWQAYGGNTFTDNDPSPIVQDRRLYGGRVTYRTPVDGLRFLFSAFHVQTQLLSDQTLHGEDDWIASGDYVHGGWDVKSEYGKHQLLGVASDAYYLQAGYTFPFARRWMPFARYDYITTDKAHKSSDSYYQKDVVVGVNFKVIDNVSLRVEDQFNHGYALPVATGEVLAGTGTPSWSLLVVGINFIF